MRTTRSFGLAFLVTMLAFGAGMACSSSDDESSATPPTDESDGGVDAGDESDADTSDGGDDGDADASDGDVLDADTDADASDGEPDADVSDAGTDADVPDGDTDADIPDGDTDADTADGDTSDGGDTGGPGAFPSWSKAFEASVIDIQSVAVSPTSGDIAIAGTFRGSVSFGASTHQSVHVDNETGFFAKFDKSGNLYWSKPFGSSWIDESNVRIAFDASDNVYVAGEFEGTIDLGGGELSAQETDVFLAKFNGYGQHLFSKRFSGSGFDKLLGLFVDSAGKVTLTGRFNGDIDFGGGTHVSSDLYDAFVAQFASDGDHVFSATFGGDGHQTGHGVATTSAGNVIVAGTFAGEISCQGGIYDSDVNAGFVMSLDAFGSCQWLEKLSNPVHGVTVDDSDEIVVLGHATVTKLSSDGSPKWEKVFTGAPSFIGLSAIAADGAGKPAVCGNSIGDPSLDGHDWSSYGKPSALYLAFDAEGTLEGSKVGSASSYASCSALAALSDGSAYVVAGYFSGNGFDLGHGALTGPGGYLATVRLEP